MRREKTVVDVNVTDAEKDAVLARMVRQQEALQSQISEQQKKQEDMVGIGWKFRYLAAICTMIYKPILNHLFFDVMFFINDSHCRSNRQTHIRQILA